MVEEVKIDKNSPEVLKFMIQKLEDENRMLKQANYGLGLEVSILKKTNQKLSEKVYGTIKDAIYEEIKDDM